ncbi:MAG: hypothetical protein ACFE9S_05895 [Candidatus Hermodarchaeota archaeon]
MRIKIYLVAFNDDSEEEVERKVVYQKKSEVTKWKFRIFEKTILTGAKGDYNSKSIFYGHMGNRFR